MSKSEILTEAKIENLKLKLQAAHAANRKLHKRVKALSQSRAHQQGKVKVLQSRIKAQSRVIHASRGAMGADVVISGHKFGSRMVSLCIALYAFGGCSFRGVRRVLLCLQMELGINESDIPSKSSIDNWIQKAGHYHYTREMDLTEDWSEYCIIVDESMVVGQQRMLLALGVRAHKVGKEALSFEEVKVLGFAVAASWKWAEVQSFLEKVADKMGTKATYVVCDGGANLKKGVSGANLLRICDVGHEICKLMEQTYRQDERFLSWIKEVAKVRFQVFMRATAYLLPPRQRTVARFTNLSSIVQWAQSMLHVLPTLTTQEQQTYGWLGEHKEIIQEFANAFKMNESILKILKNEGLSYQNIEKCLLICQNSTSTVCKKLIDKIENYLRQEKEKLPDSDTLWHMSSDILESLFGKFKHLASNNVLNGVTGRVLALCLLTSGNCELDQINGYVQQALESVSMPELKQWKMDHLFENQLLKRQEIFKT